MKIYKKKKAIYEFSLKIDVKILIFMISQCFSAWLGS